MNFPFFIANRFFFSKQKNNFVNIISWVSLIGVAVGTSALILVLSVFNGFEKLVLDMYNSFDPHIKITSTKGKTFDSNSIKLENFTNSEIDVFTYVLEEKVLLKYQDKEFIATIKGVGKNYNKLVNFDSLLINGSYINEYADNNVAVIGEGVSYYLSISLESFTKLEVYLPNRNSRTLLNPKTAFNQSFVNPVGVFRLQADIDQKYIITKLKLIQELTKKKNEISSIEIKLKNPDKMLDVQKELKKLLGKDYLVKNRLEQQALLYKILNTEKLAVFLILVFILIIATFNIIGSLSVLILDKKKEILTLKSFGSSKKTTQSIFFNTSMLTILYGTIIGLLIGIFLALIQQSFGLIKLGSGNFIIESYPVYLSALDVLLVFFTVILIGSISSWYPSRLLIANLFKK